MLLYQCIIRSDNFYPKELNCLKDKTTGTIRSPSDVVNGNVINYGGCSFNADSIEEIVSKIREINAEVYPQKLEHIEVSIIYGFAQQCNLEFSRNELELILEVGAFLTISCYEEK